MFYERYGVYGVLTLGSKHGVDLIIAGGSNGQCKRQTKHEYISLFIFLLLSFHSLLNT